jgi:demethylmenaquinone methyltransferase/2-methoxy-6-polyprenyl-1,4-benzoquinol methylase
MKKLRRFYYDCFSRVYDRFVALHSSDRQGGLRAYLAEQTGAGSGDRVLDICTGTGALLEKLHPQVAPHGMVVGIDFSRGMLSVAKEKTKGAHTVCLVQAHAGSLPFKAAVFDGVTCAHAFYELKGISQVACLKEVVRVMKPHRPFLMMEHEIPENRFVRLLFYLRLFSMGARRAVEILKEERQFLKRYFGRVEKVSTPGGHSKIWLCHANESPWGNTG